jgi:hypothetical protein
MWLAMRGAAGVSEFSPRAEGDPCAARGRVSVSDQRMGSLPRSRRRGCALPVAITTTILATGLSLSWWATTGIVIAGWVAGLALLLDGWRRDRERNDLLISLLAINKAKSPTFERLAERAKAIPSPADHSPKKQET